MPEIDFVISEKDNELLESIVKEGFFKKKQDVIRYIIRRFFLNNERNEIEFPKERGKNYGKSDHKKIVEYRKQLIKDRTIRRKIFGMYRTRASKGQIEKGKKLIELKAKTGKEYYELAKELGISPSTANVYVYYAKREAV